MILFCLVAFSMQSAMAQESKWSYKDRTDFILSCAEAANASMSLDSAKFYCYCMLGKMEIKFPDPAQALTVTEADLEKPEWKKMVRDCIGQNWSNEYRNGFMSSCVESAKPNLSEEDARSYCECMMFKIENKLPNSADADKISAETLQQPDWQKLILSCLKPKEK